MKKGLPRSLHLGHFSPRTTRSTHQRSWGGEATQTKNPLDNGEMSPLLTQPPSQYSPPVDDPDAPEAPESPPPVPPEYTSNANLLESEGDPERDCPTADNDKLFGVYQDWMHQNPGTHLDCRIDEDGKWQKIWKT